MNRRQFTRSVAGIPAAVSVILAPQKAEGSVSSILNYLMMSNPLLAVVSLIESVSDYNSGVERQAKAEQSLGELRSISDQISRITANQKAILDALADERIFIKEALKQAFLDNDAVECESIIQQFDMALALTGNLKSEKLSYISNILDTLALKLGHRGPAAAPAYMSAIALHNSVYYALGAAKQDLHRINEIHQKNISRLLYGSPDDDATLPYLFTHDQYGNKNVLYDFGRRYAFALVSLSYEGQGQPISSYALGEQFNGFRNGSPILTPFFEAPIPGSYRGVRDIGSKDIYGKKVTAGEVWFGPVRSANHTTLPGLERVYVGGEHKGEPYADALIADTSGKLTFSQSTNEVFSIQEAIVRDYYMRFYNPKSGDLSPGVIRPVTDAQENLRAFLENGSNQLARALRAA